MNEWEEIYLKNKELDQVFIGRYEKNEPYYLEKNCLAFLIELGEFVNETKCFKYWSIKKPKKDAMLEEYADCITMVLTLCASLNMDLNFSSAGHLDSKNILIVINHLFKQGSKLMDRVTEEVLCDIMANLLYVGELLNFSQDEVLLWLQKKQDIIEERLNDEY